MLKIYKKWLKILTKILASKKYRHRRVFSLLDVFVQTYCPYNFWVSFLQIIFIIKKSWTNLDKKNTQILKYRFWYIYKSRKVKLRKITCPANVGLTSSWIHGSEIFSSFFDFSSKFSARRIDGILSFGGEMSISASLNLSGVTGGFTGLFNFSNCFRNVSWIVSVGWGGGVLRR